MISAVILHYYKERQGYLELIVHSLQNGAMAPNEIIIWNNRPDSKIEVHGATVINSSKNYGCLARYMIGLMAESNCVFFQDDDLYVDTDTLEKLYFSCLPISVVGPIGFNLGKDRPYLDRSIVRESEKVDIILGRIHMCQKRILAQVFSYLSNNSDMKIFREDDILLSLVNKQCGGFNCVVPVKWHALDECGKGLSFDASHFADRDLVCKRLLDNTLN